MSNDDFKLTETRVRFIKACQLTYGDDVNQVSRVQISKILKEYPEIKWPYYITSKKCFQLGGGNFVLPKVNGSYEAVGIDVTKKVIDTVVKEVIIKKKIKNAIVPVVVGEISEEIKSLIPKPNPIFVKWGFFKDVVSVLKSGKFYPVFVTGLSGNGKTFMVEQVCSELKRPMYRANITAETDEDDLLGGFRLVKGETVWHNGPVISSMVTGSVLLLDEIDLGTEKLMCLQPVLEGKGVYIKKINKFIEPSAGFNIIATANTKGKGSESGNFIGTNVMNEAFLERFPITLEQPYPDKGTETKILTNAVALDMDVSEKESDFIDKLVLWGQANRKLYADGGIDEIITTRRLVHIISSYGIFGKNRMKAIKMCIARFDEDTAAQLLDYYTKIDETIENKKREEKRKAREAKRNASMPKTVNQFTPVPQESWGDSKSKVTSTGTSTAECPF